MKEFTLLKSEIKKAERCALNRDYTPSKVTGWSCDMKEDDLGFLTVKCEMCSNNYNTREEDVTLFVYMPDRRRSFAR